MTSKLAQQADKALAGGLNNNVYSSLQFASVQDSRENLFTSGLNNGLTTPMPPKFQFQDRQGRLNWRQIMNADVDKITQQVDLRQLESLLQNLTYARLDRGDMELFGDEQFMENFLKLFRLAQMSIEYLIYTQNYLECLTRALDMQYKNAYEQTKDVREKIQTYNIELSNLKKENQIKAKTLATYEYLIKIPKEGDHSQAIKCRHCQKFFASEQYLRKHYTTKHANIDYEKEFPSKLQVEKQKEFSQQELASQQRKEHEQLFDNMKTDLVRDLKGSIGSVEKEILQIKGQQTKLDGLGKASEAEQKRIDQQLAHSADLLKAYKEQLNKQLDGHQTSMQELVQRSVGEALRKRKREQDAELQK